MMTERARVVALEGEFALVEVHIKSACGSCEHGGSCGITTLGKLVRPRPACWRVENLVGASVGDEVLLGLEDTVLSASAVWAYLPPLFGLLLGAIWATQQGAGDGGVVLGSLAGLALGLFVSNLVSRRAGFAPRMLSLDESLDESRACTDTLSREATSSHPVVFMENKS